MSFNLGVMSAAVTLDDREYKAALGGLETASEGTFRRIAQVAAGYLSLRALYTSSQTAVRAFMVQQDAIEGVRSTLRNLGHEVESTTARFAGFASALQGKTVFGDETILANMSQGMRLGIKPGEIEDVTRAAIGLTAKLGVDLPTAMSLMAKASQGHTETLARYGIALDATKSKEEQFQELIRQGADAFPLAEAAAKTASGQMRQFRNTAGDTAEVLGGQLWKALGGTVGRVNELFKGFNDATSATQGLIVKTALLAAGLAGFSQTGLGRSLMTMKGASAQERETAKLKAEEEVKRAETDKTTAVMEEKLARQNAALAENAVAAAKNAAEHARKALVKAQSEGDPAAVAAAQNALMEAERNVTKAEVEAAKARQTLNEKTLAARAATENYAQLQNALPGVLLKVAMSQTALGKASLFTAAGFKTAAASAKAFLASIGPIGWTIIALTVAYAAYEYVCARQAAALEAQARAANEATQEQEKLIAANNRRRDEETQAATRLQTLAKYEKLNSAEMAEAKKLIAKLKSQYGDLDIALDRNTGRINANAEAWDKLRQKQREQALEEQKNLVRRLKEQSEVELTRLNNSIGDNDQNRESVAAVRGVSSPEKQLQLLKMMRDDFLDRRANREAGDVEKAIEVYQRLVDERKKLFGMRKELSGGPSPDGGEEAKVNEKLRKQREAIGETEWKIRFDAADAADQAQMLADKISGIFAEYKRQGKFATVAEFMAADRSDMTEKELEDLQKIIELEEQRRKIRKKAADENVEKELGRAQRQARKTGDNAPVREIMEREYERAKAAAATLQKAFADAESAANADGVLTDAEKAKLQDLKNELRATLDDAERWSDRIEDHDRNDKRTSRAVGSFSAAILEGLLGGNKPEEETAKNTKELVRLIREQQDDDDDDTLTFE